MGAPDYGPTNQGIVYVFETTVGPSCVDLIGTVDQGQLGWALAEAGDVDKNRTNDVLIGQPSPAMASAPGTTFLRAVLR